MSAASGHVARRAVLRDPCTVSTLAAIMATVCRAHERARGAWGRPCLSIVVPPAGFGHQTSSSVCYRGRHFTVAAVYFFWTPRLAREPVAEAPSIGACQRPVNARAHLALVGSSWLSALLLWVPVISTEIKVPSQ